MIGELANSESVKEVFKQYKVKSLYAFGSVVTGKSTDSSDIDFVVEFDRQGFKGAFDQFMGFKLELESVLERPVDLLVNRPFRNSVFQETVNNTKKLVYEAWHPLVRISHKSSTTLRYTGAGADFVGFATSQGVDPASPANLLESRTSTRPPLLATNFVRHAG